MSGASIETAAASRGAPVPTPGVRGGARESGWLRWGFVAPALMFLVAINLFPLGYNILLSFTDAHLLASEWQFVGGRNFNRIFSDPRYLAALRTTGLFVVLAVSIELIFGFCLALAMQGRFFGRAVVLTILLVPMMLSPAVMGLFWNLILDANSGILNHVLASLHLPTPEWRTNPSLKLVSLLMIDVWMWTPFMMLIALAGLNSIPRYIYEAAEVDRASRWTVFRRITLPMVAPLLLLAVLLRATDALKVFDIVMAVTGPNDPATQSLSALLYQTVLKDHYIGLGSAYAIIVLIIVVALAMSFVRYMDRLSRRQERLG